MDEALQRAKSHWPVFGLTDDVRPALGRPGTRARRPFS
jgi:hypothetical protein